MVNLLKLDLGTFYGMFCFLMQTLGEFQNDIALLLKRNRKLEVQKDNDDIWMHVCLMNILIIC
jgi:hypothetical protein